MSMAQLDSFLHCAREGSISKAAKALYVSQSALAQQISALERSLGFTLFERTSKGVSLTEQGAAFIPYAQTIVATYRTGVERCRGIGAGEVRVAADYEAMFLFVAQASRFLVQDHPDVRVVYREYSLRNVLPALLGGEADVCYFAQCERVRQAPDAVFVPLFRSRVTCFVPEGHPLAGRDRAALADLRPYPVVIVPGELDDCYAGLRRHIAQAEPQIRIVERSDNPFVQDERAQGDTDDTVYVGPHWRYGTFTHRVYSAVPLAWPHETQEGLVCLSPIAGRVKDYVAAARRAFDAAAGGHLVHMDAPSPFA